VIDTFNQLIVSEDWEGLLESKVSAIANRSESSNPRIAGINFMLGILKWAGRGALSKQPCTTIKLSNWQRRRVIILSNGVLNLATCYVKTGRVHEAMDLHKSLCDEIGKESMEPDTILRFAEILEEHLERSRALTILEEHLEAIDRSWGKQEQYLAYPVQNYCIPLQRKE